MDLYSNTKLTFGKYKGEFIYNVVKKDSPYIYWLVSIYEGIVTESVLSLLRPFNKPILLFTNRAKTLNCKQRRSFNTSDEYLESLEQRYFNELLYGEKEANNLEYLKEFPNCGVYLIEDSYNNEKVYKIGHSKNVNIRYCGLKGANLNISLICYLNTATHIQLEKDLHKKFKQFHIKGEWFRGDESIFKYFISNSLSKTFISS